MVLLMLRPRELVDGLVRGLHSVLEIGRRLTQRRCHNGLGCGGVHDRLDVVGDVASMPPSVTPCRSAAGSIDRLVVGGAQCDALLAGESRGDFNPVDTVIVYGRGVD
jgi:hypothetical protein